MVSNYNPFFREPLPYPEMYGEYVAIKYGEPVEIYTDDINNPQAWQHHYDCILNLFKDGIEADVVHNSMITINFPKEYRVRLSLFDFWFNLIMWRMLVDTHSRIKAKHVFFPEAITQKAVKNFIDTFIIDRYRKSLSNIKMNNVIDNACHCFHDIELFADYLANTINLEDMAFLQDSCHEFYECMHMDASGIPLEDVKDEGMKVAYRSIDIIKNAKKYLGYDHCLANSFRVGQGVNVKQYKDTFINIGTKPDGKGSIYASPINTSFINGGVVTPTDYFEESGVGRISQIIKKNNVGTSGSFARINGLNNMGSSLYPNPAYDCGTPNYITVIIINEKFLERYNHRYYKFKPNGIEYVINAKTDKHLIGKTILVRSPITCASNARGNGICFKCFGNLAYVLYDFETQTCIDPGRMASETLSSALTQKQLSAKHMLESAVKKLVWCNEFSNFFDIDGNVIKINSDINPKGFSLVIDPDSIEMENDEDDDISESDEIYNEYVIDFSVLDKNSGIEYPITNNASEKLYITNSLNGAIRKHGHPIDGKVHVDFNDIKDDVFVVIIRNSELSETLDHLEGLLNKNSIVKNLDANSCTQQVVSTAIKGGIDISAVYVEVIISNQIRDANDILENAKWWEPNPKYQLVTLNTALTSNPSITLSLSYQKVEQSLYAPLTARKNKASFMDLFFMERPQLFIRDEPMEEKNNFKDDEYPMVFTSEDPNGYTAIKPKK